MQRHEASLDVGAGAHFLGGAQQHADSTGIYAVEQILLCGVGLRVMDECDFSRWDAGSDELRPDILINIKSVRIRRGKIAENKLR